MLQFRLLSPFSLASNFAILGLKPSVPLTDVKRKYYELAKLYHPDVNAHDATAHKKFTEITKAYRYITENYEQERASFRTGSAAKEETTENTHGTASKFRNQKR
jgi:DnaJ-class molecular chaperone